MILAIFLIISGVVLDIEKRFQKKIETPSTTPIETQKEETQEKIVEETKEEIKLEKELEIYPYEADVQFCISSRGEKFSATGPNSATWFVWGGCARSKSYDVVPRKELILFVYTDSCPGCVCHYPNFYIFEYQNGEWIQTKFFDLPDNPNFSEFIFYIPSSDKIKIFSNSCFYLRIFSGSMEEVERELGRKIEIKQKSAEAILREFMEARMKGDEEKALSFLTENAREQFLSEAPLKLINTDILEYKILQVRELTKNSFEFVVETIIKNQPGSTVELIQVSEVLGEFFIHSVKLLG